MALNWVTLDQDGKSPVPLENERSFFCQGGVSFEFDSGSGYPGSSEHYSSPKGILFLTNLRAVFVSFPPTPVVQSLSIPIANLKNCEIVQPFFGPNYCKADLEPVPGGGIKRNGIVKFHFKEGGGFSFLALYKQLIQRRLEIDDDPDHLEPLPLYEASASMEGTPPVCTAPEQSIASSSNTIAPDNDLPPSYDTVLTSQSNATSNQAQ